LRAKAREGRGPNKISSRDENNEDDDRLNEDEQRKKVKKKEGKKESKGDGEWVQEETDTQTVKLKGIRKRQWAGRNKVLL
jgi:hypothetical protein